MTYICTNIVILENIIPVLKINIQEFFKLMNIKIMLKYDIFMIMKSIDSDVKYLDDKKRNVGMIRNRGIEMTGRGYLLLIPHFL
ncbi:MAG: hypothetical protein ACR5KW_02855 [Wolbachia sp.]